MTPKLTQVKERAIAAALAVLPLTVTLTSGAWFSWR